MPRRRGTRSAQSPRPPGYWRDRLAWLLALATVVCLGAAFLLAKDTRFLTPGPLTSGHSTIENCSACHTQSGSGKLNWIHSAVNGDPLADSRACLGCHKMPDTAFNAHSASAEVLEQSTRRLTKTATGRRVPQWARAQNAVFPTHDMLERGLYCATCHQEHKGANFNLNKISNEQCQSCHVVKFDSFDGRHPEFENYPFKRRTPIIYDHGAHGKRFPDLAKKDPAKRIPATCSSCHNSRADRRIMAVVPSEQTCMGCHLDQITGKERVSGPKGIAFLTVPGLDLQTLKKKNASIGEWPTSSEAELTPFMKVMISRTARGRALIKTVDGLSLQELADASDEQIEAVTKLVWEIKRLFYALISGKASDVLADLNISCGAKLSTSLIADLTASIPRDVVVSAQQQWLPNLGREMANRKDAGDQEDSCWITEIGGWSTTISDSETGGESTEPRLVRESRLTEASRQADARAAPGAVVKNFGVDPLGRLLKGRQDEAEAAKARLAKAEEARAEAAKAEAAKAEAAKADAARAEAARAAAAKAEAAKPEPARAEAPQPKAVAGATDTVNAKPGREALSADERPPQKAADQTDDLLAPTDDELRAIKEGGAAIRTFTIIARPDAGEGPPSADEQPDVIEAGVKDTERIAQAEEARRPAVVADAASKAPDQTDDLLNPTEEELRGVPASAAPPDAPVRRPAAAVPPDPGSKAPAPEPAAARADIPTSNPDPKPPANPRTASNSAPPAPVISIESGVDPESWAEYGGWYRQDYAIFYRPTGHKDKFIFSWLFLTGPQAPKGDRSPAAAVFDYLTSKDAQGSCTKCHSVDDIRGKGRLVNFSPPKLDPSQERFTYFIHEPHFGVLESRGCLACHNLERSHQYLQGYQQGNPKLFESNFGAVKKELCQSCHTSSMARQDCLVCHKYHANGVVTPMMTTRIPAE